VWHYYLNLTGQLQARKADYCLLLPAAMNANARHKAGHDDFKFGRGGAD